MSSMLLLLLLPTAISPLVIASLASDRGAFRKGLAVVVLAANNNNIDTSVTATIVVIVLFVATEAFFMLVFKIIQSAQKHTKDICSGLFALLTKVIKY